MATSLKGEVSDISSIACRTFRNCSSNKFSVGMALHLINSAALFS